MNVKPLCFVFLTFIIFISFLIFNFYHDKGNFWKKNKLIAHALGTIDENKYLNCLEALNNNYKKGFRFFEVDVSLSSDNIPILLHYYDSEKYFETIIKKYLNFDSEQKKTYKMFMETKLLGKYTSMDLEMLVDFAKKHPDTIFLLDTANPTIEENNIIYSYFKKIVEINPKIEKQFILGFHRKVLYEETQKIYSFENNLFYIKPEEKREKELFSIEQIINFCKENRIKFVSLSEKTYTKETAEKLMETDLKVFVFTVNDIDKIKNILKMGATAVGTDFVFPNDLIEK